MGILKKAENQNAFAKIGIYGMPGSGKTFTAACLAIGIHKYANCKKPIGFFDTEGGLCYVLPLFKAAGIEVLELKSRSFKDVKAFMVEAEKECSVVIIDSSSHIWQDLQKSYLDKLNESRKGRPLSKIEFHHWGKIKEIWNEFAELQYLHSKLHVILCGREASIYDYQTNEETGKKELIMSGSKMAIEKGLGYQPSLLLHMVNIDDDGKPTNKAIVKKDRSNFLHGEEIIFTPHKGVNLEKLLKVFVPFKPHFDTLNLKGSHLDSMNINDSKDLIPEYQSDDWPTEQRTRTIVAEEIQGELLKYYPGRTTEEQKKKAELYERFFNTRSLTKIEQETSSKVLREGLASLKSYLHEIHSPKEEIESKQVEYLSGLIEHDKPTYMERMKTAFGIDRIEDLTIPQFNKIVDTLRLEGVEQLKKIA